MSSMLKIPFSILFGIVGTLLRAVGLFLSFIFKGLRFGGSRLIAVIAGVVIGIFLGRGRTDAKPDEEKKK